MKKRAPNSAFILIVVGFFLFTVSVGVIIESAPEGERALQFGTTSPESLWPTEFYEQFSKEISEKSNAQLQVLWHSVPDRVSDVGLLQRLYLREFDGAIIGVEALAQWLRQEDLLLEMQEGGPSVKAAVSIQKALSQHLQPKGYEILSWMPPSKYTTENRMKYRLSAWIVRTDRLQGMEPSLREELTSSAKRFADKVQEHQKQTQN